MKDRCLNFKIRMMKNQFQKFLDACARVFRHLFVYLPPFVGLTLIVLCGYNIIFPNSDSFREIVNTIGIALLTGGLLSLSFSVLKYFRYFQNILSDLLYGREFLEKRTDLNILWSNITSILYHRRFPKIATKIHSLLKENYFDSENPFYSSYAELKITYKKVSDNRYVVTDVIKQKYIASSEMEFKIRMSSDIDFSVDDKDDIHNRLLKFIVNDEVLYTFKDQDEGTNRQERIEGASIEIIPYNKDNRMVLDFDLTLSGKTEYNTIRVIEKKYDLINNPMKRWIASHIYRRLSVFVSYPEDLINLTYSGAGTVDEIKSIPTGNLCNLELEYNNILLPRQGIFFGVALKKH